MVQDVLSLHVPTIAEFSVRRAWLTDPEMMSYNAGWSIRHPGYDPASGCIDWPESDWSAFQARLALPPARQGFYYIRDTDTDEFIGYIHYLVDPAGTAEIGFNVIPERRGRGLGAQFLRLLLRRVWEDTPAQAIVQEFEDERLAAVQVHQHCGFTPDAETTSVIGRQTRAWRINRP